MSPSTSTCKSSWLYSTNFFRCSLNSSASSPFSISCIFFLASSGVMFCFIPFGVKSYNTRYAWQYSKKLHCLSFGIALAILFRDAVRSLVLLLCFRIPRSIADVATEPMSFVTTNRIHASVAPTIYASFLIASLSLNHFVVIVSANQFHAWDNFSNLFFSTFLPFIPEYVMFFV